MIQKIINKIKKIDEKLSTMRIQELVNTNFINAETERCGNNYGGFFVLSSRKYCNCSAKTVLTFGIGEDLSFSENIKKLFNPQIYAFDPTPKSIKFVKNHWLAKDPDFHFFPIGLSDKNEITEFHLPVNPAYVSGSIQVHEGVRTESINVEMESLLTICSENGISTIDILKMDIEGSEFAVIPNIISEGLVFNELCIETHERYFKDRNKKMLELFTLLIKNGYKFISANGNEYTLIKENLLIE